MHPIILYTLKNWNMIRYVFDGQLNEHTNTFTVWIDLEFHKDKIDKIARVNQYLASVIKEQALHTTCLEFKLKLRQPLRKHIRYGKLQY